MRSCVFSDFPDVSVEWDIVMHGDSDDSSNSSISLDLQEMDERQKSVGHSRQSSGSDSSIDWGSPPPSSNALVIKSDLIAETAEGLPSSQTTTSSIDFGSQPQIPGASEVLADLTWHQAPAPRPTSRGPFPDYRPGLALGWESTPVSTPLTPELQETAPESPEHALVISTKDKGKGRELKPDQSPSTSVTPHMHQPPLPVPSTSTHFGQSRSNLGTPAFAENQSHPSGGHPFLPTPIGGGFAGATPSLTVMLGLSQRVWMHQEAIQDNYLNTMTSHLQQLDQLSDLIYRELEALDIARVAILNAEVENVY
ncbi:hypothetical protein JAAARDRAFT_194128 [Jaapia argillacea MUCL 33604]|uniref:Uncharacterized protein n=1 Tax=Jaapia argillacea MUCL 33604 TaxID=933084 RepID=A0A067Q2Y8_9AGAM|nr:hypothetical protein JAAARDRAFT_194128 [Jaapia argillacea MUCL 33604]